MARFEVFADMLDKEWSCRESSSRMCCRQKVSGGLDSGTWNEENAGG